MGAPVIAFMDYVAKQFGCNVNLGQAFWEALAHTTFPSKTCLFPMVRVALALANMTSDKVEDHVARLLRKADVGKVASKPQLAVAMEHEQALQTGFDIAMTLGGCRQTAPALGTNVCQVWLAAHR